MKLPEHVEALPVCAKCVAQALEDDVVNVRIVALDRILGMIDQGAPDDVAKELRTLAAPLMDDGDEDCASLARKICLDGADLK